MEQNENESQSSLGLLETMPALQPKFQNVIVACDDTLIIQTHRLMLVDISTVSGGLLAYIRGGGASTQFEDKKG